MGNLKQFGEKPFRGCGGLAGDFGDRDAADFGHATADERDIGGFGKDFAVFVDQMRLQAVSMRGGEVRGVGFKQKPVERDGGGVFPCAGIVGTGQGAAKRNMDVVSGEIGERVHGAGIGMDEEARRVRGERQENFEHFPPGVAAMQAGREREFEGKVQLGAEDGFPVGVEAVFHAGVEADFADAGGAGGQESAQVLQPAGGAVADEPGVEAEGADREAGMGVGEGCDGGPVGLAGRGEMDACDAGGEGPFENARQMRREAGVLEMGMGVEPGKNRAVRRGWRCYAHLHMLVGPSKSVNAQWVRGACMALALGWVAAGCSTFSTYPAGMEQTTLGPLRAGNKTGYEKTFEKRTDGRDGALFGLEKGRVAQLEGDYGISRAAFEGAIDRIREQDEQALISASGAAAQTGAVLVNDKAIPYRPPSYERTLVHHYQALNYLATNDLIGAGVEVRRANREQEEALRRRAREAEKAGSKEKNVSPDDERDPHLTGVYAGLDEMAGAVKNSFQNAATFYLSAVIWEMLGEANDAYIDYKKALEIYPENPYLQRAAIRVGRRLGMREDVAAFERRFPEAAKGAETEAGKARLMVLYEEGLAPQKTEVSIAYPLSSGDALGTIAMPAYGPPPPPPSPATLRLDGKNAGTTEPICSVSALAARALAEQMPGILTRQVARAIAKGVGAHAAKEAAGDFGALLATIYNVASEQADLRSWLSLPAHVQVLDVWVAPGESAACLAGPGGTTIWAGKVTMRAGKTTMLVVTRIDLAVYSRQFVQP